MTFHHQTRRRFLATSAAAGGALAAGLRPAFAQSVPDIRKFAGTMLEVNLIKSPRGDLLQKYNKEFEDLTGIKINAEQIPEQQQRQKAVVELASGKPSFDVVHLSYHVQKRQFEKGKWLADLTPFINDSRLTPANYLADFNAAGKAFASDGKAIGGLPWSVDYWIVYWNKELFAKKNLKYPGTFEELASVAEQLTDPASQTYGFVARGLKNANTPVWTSFMLGHDTYPIVDGQIRTETPEAIDAAKLYQRLLTKAAPQGVSGFNWSECQSAFLQGRIGMWLDGVGFAPPLEDPDKSRVVGKVGYSVMPKGPKNAAAPTFGDGIGVTAATTKKEAAYLYCQWAVSPEMGARLFSTGSGVPFRESVLKDPAVRKTSKLPAEWVEAVEKSGEISRLALPVIIPVTEFRDIYGVALTNLISGADAKDELRKATEQFRPVLERSEKA